MPNVFSLDDFPIPTILAKCAQIDLDSALVDGRVRLTPEQAESFFLETECVEANQGALDLFGSPTVEGFNNGSGVFRGEFLAWFHEAIECLLTDEQTEWRETLVYTRTGRQIPALGRARALRDGAGGLTHIIWSFIDISPLKEAEANALVARDAADAANRAKSGFLAVMSHEIRTPLNGVLGMAQLLLKKQLPDDEREMVSIINSSGETLLTILNDLLDLAKIEAGRLDLEDIPFDITELGRSVHNAFSAVAAKKELELTLSVNVDACGMYSGDPTRLRQILNNLVSNALKFTEAGQVVVDVSRLDGDMIVAVRDSGIGLTADQVDRLFERFSQAESSTTRRFGGTGLGLAICQELAQLMGGSITVESAVGAGTTFKLRIPMTWLGVDETAVAAGAGHQEASNLEMGRIRVLAAEDNSVNQLVLRSMLMAMGIDVTIVGNGLEALDALKEDVFDVVLMDIQMPVMDGVAAVTELRRRERTLGLRRTPVIALTANAMTHQTTSYLSAGMDATVEKPIQIEKLIRALAQVVEGETEDTQTSAMLRDA